MVGHRILDHRKGRAAVAIPVVRPFPSLPHPFFLHLLYFACSRQGKRICRFLCAPSHFPSKLFLTLDTADNSPLRYTPRPITALFTELSCASFDFSQVYLLFNICTISYSHIYSFACCFSCTCRFACLLIHSFTVYVVIFSSYLILLLCNYYYRLFYITIIIILINSIF